MVQIHGGKARGRLVRLFAFEDDYSDTDLRAASPDGDQVFIITRTWEGVHVYSADGKMVGKIVGDPVLEEKRRIMQIRWKLMDWEEVVHGTAVQRLTSKGSKHMVGGSAPVHSHKIDYMNTYGTEIAFFDGRWVTLKRALPDSLQLLVMASPIAFELLAGA